MMGRGAKLSSGGHRKEPSSLNAIYSFTLFKNPKASAFLTLLQAPQQMHHRDLPSDTLIFELFFLGSEWA